ncbi:hypothetical protein OIDMADRAFT_47172 [Oidiodendron maius Zn]|uniref:Uncharacterized protein n=1 Tax=Oidiodendron maius (strain Zn) TaxID=913774 RepID=A0A0C3D7E0_OIDMZ|nr:hypothetical protein OIDMADRAFT_47172 [Oidiodendron maius Zn]
MTTHGPKQDFLEDIVPEKNCSAARSFAQAASRILINVYPKTKRIAFHAVGPVMQNVRDIAPVPALTTTVATASTASHVTTTTSAPPSTITSPPPWGDQVLAENTCYQTSTDGSIEYLSCTMHLGVVEISYFPQNSANATYPSTWYNPEWSVTMTSPSLYMLVETAWGNNQCGTLGPTFSNKVVSMPISHALTMQPYANSAAVSRMGPPRPLTLNDLAGCSTLPSNLWSLIPAIMTLHPIEDSFYRCNPHFVVPPEVWAIGGPYWKNCAHFNDEVGIFDPPGAVPTVSGLLPITSDSPVAITPTTATTIAAANPDQPKVTPSSSTSTTTKTSTSTSTSSPTFTTSSLPTPTSNARVQSTSTSASKPEGVPDVPAATDRLQTTGAVPNKPVVIGTIASFTITAAVGATSVLVGSQTATLGGPEITLDNHFVVTAAPKAIMVYMPAGGVSSLAWPTVEVANGQPHDNIQTSVGIGGIIASFVGASPSATPNSVVTTASTTSVISKAITSSSSSSDSTVATTSTSIPSSFSSTSCSSSNMTRSLNYTTILVVTTSSSMILSTSTMTLVSPLLSSSITTSSTETTTNIPLGAINRPPSASNVTITTSTAQSGQTNPPAPDSGARQMLFAHSRLGIVLVISSVLGLLVL